MTIKQLNASYVREEDRVLLRLTTAQGQELRLWLTRAVVADLLGLLEDAAVRLTANDPTVQDAAAVAAFRQQALAQSLQTTSFQPAANLPLGSAPVLVTSARLLPQDQRVAVQLVLATHQQVTLGLTQSLAGKLRLMLERMDGVAHWRLGPAGGPAAHAAPAPDDAPGGPRTVH